MSVGATWGKILHVDLTTKKTWVETPPDELYLKLVGGRALEAYLLLRDLPVGADPLGPENLLIFAPGIFQGTNLPGAGRHSVGAKSPLTGAIGSSEAGGWWGHEFKRAGWDALVVHGRSESPVYLWINDDQVEIRPADHLWGRDVADVENAIRAELNEPRLRVAQCGIAGENLVLMANVINDNNRAAGRTGLGAVMGSKKLKAVAVRGTRNVPVADRRRLTELSKWLGENYKTLAAWAHEKGTPGGLTGLNRVSALPTRNFQDPDFPDAESIGWETLHTSILIGRDTCQACPIECKQVVSYDGEDFPDSPAFKTQVKDEVKIDKVYGGPEYETLGSYGSTCGVNDIVAVSKANEWSARWGLDPISTGMTIAFVMECVEHGLLTAEMTGGFLPRWGNSKDMLEAVDMIAHRRGFGDKMAMGSKRLAQWIGKGAEQHLVEVKGQELPMHEPRYKAALGIGYAVAPVGADHMMNIHDSGYATPGRALDRVNTVYKVGPMPSTELSTEKMTLFYYEVNWQHFQDCAICCMFYPYDYIQLAEALSAMTGHEYTPLDILAVGERAQQLCRLFNLREGFTEKDDRLPKRVMQAFKTGPLAGVEITEEAFYRSRQTWYGLMGWTPEGVPTQERLAKLGLMELLNTK
ncbi:MAG: aldehyde ferredoxin oxidoreductase family protein [Anaerolineae bacterium]